MADLEARPLVGEVLVVEHGLQHLAVTPGHQAHGAQDLQHRDLRLDVVRRETLRDHVDALRVRQHVRASLLQNNIKTWKIKRGKQNKSTGNF